MITDAGGAGTASNSRVTDAGGAGTADNSRVTVK